MTLLLYCMLAMLTCAICCAVIDGQLGAHATVCALQEVLSAFICYFITSSALTVPHLVDRRTSCASQYILSKSYMSEPVQSILKELSSSVHPSWH